MYLGVALIVGYSLFPIYWITLSALKPSRELFRYPPSLVTLDLSLESFFKLFRLSHFSYFFWNSIYVCVWTILITIPLATLGAYGLTRFKFPGGESYAKLTLFIYMVPPVLLVIPLYIIMVKMHLGNTLAGLILIYTALSLPFSLWLLRAFFQTVPIELEEAALIDGASRFRMIISVFLPVAFPGIVATAVFVFGNVFNEYIFALVLISSTTKKTIPVGLATFLTDFEILWEYILTGSVIATIPIVIFFLFFQRYLIKGWGAGAVKG